MSVLILPTLTHRDRSVLRAVAAGRCQRPGPGSRTVDGMALADQFAGLRLADAGLITVAAGPVASPTRPRPADRRVIAEVILRCPPEPATPR
jgi:hypothetical protein